MNRYLTQLLADVAYATAHVQKPYVEPEEVHIGDLIPEKEERLSAPRKSLAEWTGISKDALPPHALLTDAQLEMLFEALKKMLDAYNMSIVFIFITPVRIQYQILRKYYDQELPMLQWNMGFFDVCPEKQSYNVCLLGEQCQCRYFDEMRAGFVDEDLTSEEERARELEIEVQHIQKKYGMDWMKYYPYYLDPEYDDEYGNPYDYGMLDDEDEEADDWWRK